MAQLLTRLVNKMADRNNGQLIHIAISIIGVVATSFTAYYANQISIEKFMSRTEEKMAAQSMRIATIEQRQTATGEDRLTMERRITGLEITQGTMLGVLREVRDDVRAVREGKR
jgi:NADP-dependent 3-hydroxy acid dehydrogenase YdfG